MSREENFLEKMHISYLTIHQIHLSFLMPVTHLLENFYPLMVIANKNSDSRWTEISIIPW